MTLIQLHLFEPVSRPNWWTEHDTAAVMAWLELREPPGKSASAAERKQAELQWMKQWNCRRCRFWNSQDGRHGRCEAAEARGWTGAGFTCEQWDAINLSGSRQ